MSLTPPVNVSGMFTLANPFNQDVIPNTPYTVIAVRKFADIIRKGENPYEVYYLPRGLTQSDYQRDTAALECIVTLRSAAGQFIYVPTSYILSYPNQSGVRYTAIALLVQLGAIPDTSDLSAVRTRISNVVRDTYGLTPTIQQLSYSDTVLKSAGDHAAIEAARTAAITEHQTDYAKYQQALATVTAQALRIQQLEAYIKSKLSIIPDPCSQIQGLSNESLPPISST